MLLLQLAAVLAATWSGDVSAVAVTYVPSGAHQQYSSPQPPPSHLSQTGAPQQYLARPEQGGAPQQYLARPEQGGAPQQYLARPEQGGAPQQYQVRPQAGRPLAEPEDFDANPQYQFSFDVKDDQFTNYQNRKEQREGDKITGSYSVVDSDGFIRTVKYTADPREGFKAEVTREPTSIVVKVPTPPPALQAQYSAGGDSPQAQQFAGAAAPQAARHDAVQRYLQASDVSHVYSSLGQQTPQQFARQRAVAAARPPQPSPEQQQFLGQQPQFTAPGAAAPKGAYPAPGASAGDIYHGYQQ